MQPMRAWRSLLNRLRPVRWIRQRIDAWVLARVGKSSGPVVVRRNRIYIVPTRFGWGFAIMCVVMLLGAMNYSNSMAFALAFLLVGLGLVCMHHTHANLLAIQLRAGRAQPVFVGETAHFELLIDNPSSRPRYALEASWARELPAEPGTHVPGLGFGAIRLTAVAPRRGWLDSGVFSVSTEFPLGLFHAWSWIHLDLRCLVFPHPAHSGLPPPVAGGSGGAASGSRAGQDEFSGLRTYQRGDSLRSIHWKSVPKSRMPMVKQFSESVEQALWLSWDSMSTPEVEARLSQLTRWVLDADREGRAYGLRLPGMSIAPGRGEAHRFECLKALALFRSATP
ncbi:MAG: DUF58 domain-containing protein [Panacagrimonas sp.]